MNVRTSMFKKVQNKRLSLPVFLCRTKIMCEKGTKTSKIKNLVAFLYPFIV